MVLAANTPAAKPGLLGFLVVAGLGVATFFLLRSMTKRVRNINFSEQPPDDAGGSGRPDTSGREADSWGSRIDGPDRSGGGSRTSDGGSRTSDGGSDASSSGVDRQDRGPSETPPA